MLCQGCGYALWNLPEPRCPECGRAFDRRDYFFVPNTVAFACPDCGKHHAGTGKRFLPAADADMTCEGCARLVRVASMSVVPLVDPPVNAEWGEPIPLPWEDGTRHGFCGFLSDWFLNMRLVMRKPTKMANALRETTTSNKALTFAGWTLLLGWLQCGLIVAPFLLIISIEHWETAKPDAVHQFGSALGVLVLIALCVLAFALASLILFEFLVVPAHFALHVTPLRC